MKRDQALLKFRLSITKVEGVLPYGSGHILPLRRSRVRVSVKGHNLIRQIFQRIAVRCISGLIDNGIKMVAFHVRNILPALP